MTITACPVPKDIDKMSDLFKNPFLCIIRGTCTALLHMLKYIPGVQKLCNEAVARSPSKLRRVPDYFKTQKMCDAAIRMDPGMVNFITPDGVLLRMASVLLFFVPDHLKTQEMCDKMVAFNPYMLDDVPDYFKTQEMCNEAVRRRPWLLCHILDHLKTQKMCDAAVMEDPWLLNYVPSRFVTQQQVKL